MSFNPFVTMEVQVLVRRPVPTLENVLCVLTAKELGPAQEKCLLSCTNTLLS